jgi:hypothetical protein
VCHSRHTEPLSIYECSQPVVLCVRKKKSERVKIIAVRVKHKPGQGNAAAFRSQPVAASGLRICRLFCVAVVSYSSRGSVRVSQRPDVGQRAADVPIRVSPCRLARSTRCMAAGRPYLYLIYIVDQIACDFRPLAREFFTRAYMRRRMVLLIEVRNMISFFSIVRNDGERNGLSVGFITTKWSGTARPLS